MALKDSYCNALQSRVCWQSHDLARNNCCGTDARGTHNALHVRAYSLKSLRLFVLFYMIFKCLLRTDTLSKDKSALRRNARHIFWNRYMH